MRPRLASTFFALTSVALGLVACGGAVSSELFSTDVPTRTDSGSTPGTDSGGGGDPDGTTPPPDPTTDPTTNPTDPPPPPPPPPPQDAGRDVNVRDASDASVVVDAGAGGITCGPTLSCGLTDTCCAIFNVSYRFECRTGTSAACPSPSTDIHCDSSEDCPTSARLCCGDKSGSGTFYNELKCRSSCTGSDVIFCNPASPVTSCGAGRACKESQIIRGFYYCD